ncbi:MAG: magnesium chelatase, partial [Deltaproteobacteria bacterium]|nr:magnesium chelatase [Deltaproteobacteria bacterium]
DNKKGLLKGVANLPEQLFPGIIGYDDTVIPEIENAILSCHDIILLGERGQAKTRIMRSLTTLLDESLPVISGCEINDDPFQPLCKHCHEQIKKNKGKTRIEWVSREMRFSEKLATPDVTIADLIGDIDPIKIAEGRYLSDELAIHYGLIPRTNRGIFSINELPDLHEKIQVGLFNLLEERDVQIRGYKIALPLDIFIIATANPEDYTSRGRIITPLKDRFGAQIRTHYPKTLEEEIAIVKQERAPFTTDGFTLRLPHFMEEIIAEISQMARRRSEINHSSGISVRMSIHNMENMISNAFRRAIRLNEKEVVPRITDLIHLSSSMKGKIEWDFIEDNAEEEKINILIRDAISKIFRQRLSHDSFADFIKEFSSGNGFEISEITPSPAYLRNIESYPSLKVRADQLSEDASQESIASAVEFILEGLAIGGKIKKEIRETSITYDSRQ